MLLFQNRTCEFLWCAYGRRCRKEFIADPDGAPCSHGRWCQSGKCVAKGETVPSTNQQCQGQWYNMNIAFDTYMVDWSHETGRVHEG